MSAFVSISANPAAWLEAVQRELPVISQDETGAGAFSRGAAEAAREQSLTKAQQDLQKGASVCGQHHLWGVNVVM